MTLGTGGNDIGRMYRRTRVGNAGNAMCIMACRALNNFLFAAGGRFTMDAFRQTFELVALNRRFEFPYHSCRVGMALLAALGYFIAVRYPCEAPFRRHTLFHVLG